METESKNLNMKIDEYKLLIKDKEKLLIKS